MDEQMDLFNEVGSKEMELQECFSDALRKVLCENYLDEKAIRYEKKQSYWSLIYCKEEKEQGMVVFRYKFGSKVKWMEFPRRIKAMISEDHGISKKFDEDSGYTRIYLNDEEEAKKLVEIVAASLDAAIESGPMEYSCCSRYMQCSEKNACVNPHKEIAAECRYRVNLKHGKNFFSGGTSAE